MLCNILHIVAIGSLSFLVLWSGHIQIHHHIQDSVYLRLESPKIFWKKPLVIIPSKG